MTRGFILGLVVLCSFAVTAEAKGSKEEVKEEVKEESNAQNWETREQDAWVEDGVIYAKGSAKMATMTMSLRTSETRARSNLSNALATNAISGYSPLPADTKEPTTFNVNGVSGTFGDVTKVNTFIAEDGTVFTLVSSAGAEVNQ